MVATTSLAAPARGGVPHTVQPGESLSSVAAANGMSAATLAADNGLSSDAWLLAGQTIDVPSVATGASPATTGTATTGTLGAGTASTGMEHTVQPGESLSSVAAANGISAATLAADNGLSSDAWLLAGQTIDVPTSVGSLGALSPGAGGGPATPTPAPPALTHPYWTSPIYCPSCPSGEAYLASNAASAWNAMRQASLRIYGTDLYPGGPLSGYRSYAMQLYLYDLYRSGQGNLAAVPGTSSHEYGTALDLADPSMRLVIDQIGAGYGWEKTEAGSEWWHVNYVGP